jgi:hypothetical protein
MAGIKNFKSFVSKHGEDKAREILSQDVRVTEKFDAFRFSFEKHPKTYKIVYYGKNGKTPLNRVDRSINDLYEAAIEYIENLPFEIKKSIPIRQRFGFSWFPSNSPLLTEYEKRPRNGLILTDITVRNNKFDVINEVRDNSVFERWAHIFRVDYAKPVFEGKLSKETVDSLIESCNNEGYELLKESEVFTPGFLNHSKENVEALVFEFENELIKLGKDPETSNESRSHLFDIILLNICEHLESFPLSNIKVASVNPDEGYIEVVSEVFNDYIEKRGSEFLESGLKKPEFLNRSGELSKKWIRNPKTLNILESNADYEYLFSIFLANLRKPRYKSGLISESVAQSFNQKIEEIDRISGNDFGFLEFSSIIREDLVSSSLINEDKEKPVTQKENLIVEPAQPDYVKAVSLLTRFFSPDRNEEPGKTPVNVIITNVNAVTNDIVDEAERLKKLNGNKSVLVHSRTLHDLTYGAEETNTPKLLNAIVEENGELFVGYKIVDRPFFRKLLDSLRPEYEPITIYTEQGYQDLKNEQEGLAVVYSPGSTMNIDIQNLRMNHRSSLHNSLEQDNYKEFQKLTPKCMHPYWNQIKASFDKYYYN